MKRAITFILAASMLAAALTGCGQQKAPTVSETPPEVSENFNATGYPIVNEPVTLHVFASRHGLSEEYSTIQTFIDLEEQTNVKIEWEYSPEADWETQKPLLLASNDIPEVFVCSVLGESDVLQNPTLFYPMEDYIEQYCPNIQAMFEENPSLEKLATAPDGHIYGLPKQMPCRPDSFTMGFINQQWLDNLGLEMPTTTDELYEVLKAFKEQDANGNGDPNDEIPLSGIGMNNLAGITPIFAWFGAVHSVNSWFEVNDGVVEYIPTSEEFKEGIKYLQKLYTEGLIDQELFTNDWSSYPAKLNPEGDSLVGVGFHWSIETAVGPTRKEEYTQLLPMKGPNGDQYWPVNPEAAKNGTYYAEVTAACEHPEIAMRWLDALYDQKTSMQTFYGPIGTTMEENADGTYTVLDPPEGVSGETWAWQYSWGDQGPMYVGDAFSEKITPSRAVREKLEADKNYAPYFKDEYYPLVTFTQEENDELSIISTDVTKCVDEMMASWITGASDIDADWDSYLQQLSDMKLDRMIEIYQAAYDRYMG